MCTTAISIIGTAEKRKNKTIDERSINTVSNYNGDFLDQYQNSTIYMGWSIYPNQWIAQSFTPTLNVLTRVQLYMVKVGEPPSDVNIYFSIRDSLNGEDLTSKVLDYSQLPPSIYNPTWIEIDFKNISVIPNNLYYIVCETTTGSWENCYAWLFTINSGYANGATWYTHDQGQTWVEMIQINYPNNDCCFRTYGFNNNNNPPNTPTITGEINGKIKTSYYYRIQTTDPNQNNVQYCVDWGDDTNVTTDFYESGKQISISHTWITEGTYMVKVKAVDEYGAESDWATLTVTMPCSYIIPFMPFWLKLLERFPNAFPILRYLLGNY
jgi:hypothetical protein